MIFYYLFDPKVFKPFESLLVSQVKNKQKPISILIESLCNGLELLLTSSVPKS